MLFHGKVVILQTQVGNSTCRRISSAPAFAAFLLSALRTMAAMRALGVSMATMVPGMPG